MGVVRQSEKRPPEFVSRILGPEKARKPHDSSGFSGVYAQNLPTNSAEEAHLLTTFGGTTVHSWQIPDIPGATLVYPNQDRKFEHDDIVDAVVEAQDGRVICRGQCLFTGHRVLGLAFSNEKGREIACCDLVHLTSDFAIPDHGEEGDLGCDHCPLGSLCNDAVCSAFPWN